MTLSRRDFLAGAAGAAGAAALTGMATRSFAQGEGAAPGARPNVLLIESDDHHWFGLGAMGNPAVKTPNLDKLAARGVLFRNNVCQGAECVPSRHSLLCGCYPHNNGVYSNRCQAVDERQWTLPAAMQRAGYRTALIGKNHFRPRGDVKGKKDAADPAMIEGWKTYGFDDVRATLGKVAAASGWGEGPYRAYLRDKGKLEVLENDYATNRKHRTPGYRYYTGPMPLDPEDTHDGFIRQLFTSWLADYRDERPFFAWVDFVAPHFPCDAPEPYSSMYDPADMPPIVRPENLDRWPERLANLMRTGLEKDSPETIAKVRAGYYAMISLLDDQVGEMVDALEKKGALDNTVIAFVGDQGVSAGDHGLYGKGTFVKGSINSPLLISSPARFRQGARVEGVVEMQDLAPTFLDIAGAGPKETRNAYGQSLMPLLTGEGEYPREAAFAEKLSTKMIATNDFKYIYDPSYEIQLLFDLKNDPDETRNLAGLPDYLEKEKEMQERLLAWLSETYAHPNSFRWRK